MSVLLTKIKAELKAELVERKRLKAIEQAAEKEARAKQKRQETILRERQAAKRGIRKATTKRSRSKQTMEVFKRIGKEVGKHVELSDSAKKKPRKKKVVKSTYYCAKCKTHHLNTSKIGKAHRRGD